jgi:hypothetical protein
VDADEIGHELFGRRCRLKLALWIHALSEPRFFQSQPPRDVINQSDAARELARLVRLGMLVEERSGHDRRVYYIRTDSPLWEIITAARTVTEAGVPHSR